jgi:hypothetical protein
MSQEQAKEKSFGVLIMDQSGIKRVSSIIKNKRCKLGTYNTNKDNTSGNYSTRAVQSTWQVSLLCFLFVELASGILR